MEETSPLVAHKDSYKSFIGDAGMDSAYKVIGAVAITIGDEEVEMLRETLLGVASSIWNMGKVIGDIDMWRKFVVVIIAEEKVRNRADLVEFLERKGIVDSVEGGDVVEGIKVVESVFGGEDSEMECPLQMVFALKDTNSGKIESHHWFFTEYCEANQPKYCFVRFSDIVLLAKLKWYDSFQMLARYRMNMRFISCMKHLKQTLKLLLLLGKSDRSVHLLAILL